MLICFDGVGLQLGSLGHEKERVLPCDETAENRPSSSRFRIEHKAEAWIMAPKPNCSRLAEHFDLSNSDRPLYSWAAIGMADRFRSDFVTDFATHTSLFGGYIQTGRCIAGVENRTPEI